MLPVQWKRRKNRKGSAGLSRYYWLTQGGKMLIEEDICDGETVGAGGSGCGGAPLATPAELVPRASQLLEAGDAQAGEA